MEDPSFTLEVDGDELAILGELLRRAFADNEYVNTALEAMAERIEDLLKLNPSPVLNTSTIRVVK